MDEMYEVRNNHHLISTDRSKLDITVIHDYLSRSYWAENIPRHIVVTSIEHSLCFGLYANESQIGFARVITDRATFAYLADVFILEQHRGQGLSKWLIQTIHSHPQLQNLRGWLLATKDAHGLYQQFGWIKHPSPERIMRKGNPDMYKNQPPENLN